MADPNSAAAAETSAQAATAGTVTAAATTKLKVTSKLTLVVEYTGDVDESKAYSVNIVKSLRDAGLTVKAEFAETVPSKRSL